MTAPAVSVVIVNWNTRDLLAVCLSSLESDGLPCEVTVVDNASTDGSAAMVRQRFPRARLIENATNVGFARANNQGIETAAGRYVCLLNSDTRVCPGALAALVAFMDAHPRAGACGPRLLNPDGSLQPSAHPMLTPERELWRLLFLDAVSPRATYPVRSWAAGEARRVEVIKGACLLLRRAALDQTGPLDESHFMYTEEVDLCFRLAQAGWELWWAPQAEVIHHGEASTGQAREEMYLHLYRSKARFFRKVGGEAAARRFRGYVRLAYAPRWAAAALAGVASRRMRSRRRLFGRLLREAGSF